MVNCCPVSNLPLWGKLIERVVVAQLQQFLEDADCLDLFQPGFKPGYGMETAAVILMEDLRRNLDGMDCSSSLISQQVSIPSNAV